MSFTPSLRLFTQESSLRHVLQKLAYSDTSLLTIHAKSEIENTANLAKNAFATSEKKFQRMFELKIKEFCAKNEQSIMSQDLDLIEIVAQKFFGGQRSELQEFVDYMRNNIKQNAHRFQDILDDGSSNKKDDSLEESLSDNCAGEEANSENKDQTFQFSKNDQAQDISLNETEVHTISNNDTFVIDASIFSTKNLTMLAVGTIGLTVLAFLTKGLLGGSNLPNTQDNDNELNNSLTPAPIVHGPHYFSPFDNRKFTPIQSQNISQQTENELLQQDISFLFPNDPTEHQDCDSQNAVKDPDPVINKQNETNETIVEKEEEDVFPEMGSTKAIPYNQHPSAFGILVSAVSTLALFIFGGVAYCYTKKQPQDFDPEIFVLPESAIQLDLKQQNTHLKELAGPPSRQAPSPLSIPLVKPNSNPEPAKPAPTSNRKKNQGSKQEKLAGAPSPQAPSPLSIPLVKPNSNPKPAKPVEQKTNILPLPQQKRKLTDTNFVKPQQISAFNPLFLKNYREKSKDYPEIFIGIDGKKIGLLEITAKLGEEINNEIASSNKNKNFKKFYQKIANIAKDCSVLLDSYERIPNPTKENYATLLKACNFIYACLNKFQINHHIFGSIEFPALLPIFPSTDDRFTNEMLKIKFGIIRYIINDKTEFEAQGLLYSAKTRLIDDVEIALIQLLSPYEIAILIKLGNFDERSNDDLELLNKALTQSQNPQKKSQPPKNPEAHVVTKPQIKRKINFGGQTPLPQVRPPVVNLQIGPQLAVENNYQNIENNLNELKRFLPPQTPPASPYKAPQPAKQDKPKPNKIGKSNKPPLSPFEKIESPEKHRTPTKKKPEVPVTAPSTPGKKINLLEFTANIAEQIEQIVENKELKGNDEKKSEVYKQVHEVSNGIMHDLGYPIASITTNQNCLTINKPSINQLFSIFKACVFLQAYMNEMPSGLLLTSKGQVGFSENPFISIPKIKEFENLIYTFLPMKWAVVSISVNENQVSCMNEISLLKSFILDNRNLFKFKNISAASELLSESDIKILMSFCNDTDNKNELVEVYDFFKRALNALDYQQHNFNGVCQILASWRYPLVDNYVNQVEDVTDLMESEPSVGKFAQSFENIKTALTPSKKNKLGDVAVQSPSKNGKFVNLNVLATSTTIVSTMYTELQKTGMKKISDEIAKKLSKQIVGLSKGIFCKWGFLYDNNTKQFQEPKKQILIDSNELKTIFTSCVNIQKCVSVINEKNIKGILNTGIVPEIVDKELSFAALQINWAIILMLMSSDDEKNSSREFLRKLLNGRNQLFVDKSEFWKFFSESEIKIINTLLRMNESENYNDVIKQSIPTVRPLSFDVGSDDEQPAKRLED